jgi:hypothetical protein
MKEIDIITAQMDTEEWIIDQAAKPECELEFFKEYVLKKLSEEGKKYSESETDPEVDNFAMCIQRWKLLEQINISKYLEDLLEKWNGTTYEKGRIPKWDYINGWIKECWNTQYQNSITRTNCRYGDIWKWEAETIDEFLTYEDDFITYNEAEIQATIVSSFIFSLDGNRIRNKIEGRIYEENRDDLKQEKPWEITQVGMNSFQEAKKELHI